VQPQMASVKHGCTIANPEVHIVVKVGMGEKA